MPIYNLNENGRKALNAFLFGLPNDNYEIIVQPKGELKSRQKMRGLAHTWLKIIADEAGMDKEALKLEIKRGLPFTFKPHDVRADLAFKLIVSQIKKIDGHDCSDELKVFLEAWTKRVCLVMRSSEDYTDSEYSEFIDAIDATAHKLGIILPQPERE